MKYNIPDRVLRDIASFAHKHNIENVILFGSRAKGTHTERSDIEIAGGGDFDSFYWDSGNGVSDELKKRNRKGGDGITIRDHPEKFCSSAIDWGLWKMQPCGSLCWKSCFAKNMIKRKMAGNEISSFSIGLNSVTVLPSAEP